MLILMVLMIVMMINDSYAKTDPVRLYIASSSSPLSS